MRGVAGTHGLRLAGIERYGPADPMIKGGRRWWVSDTRTTPALPRRTWVPVFAGLSALCFAVAAVLAQQVVAQTPPAWDATVAIAFHEAARSSGLLVVVGQFLRWAGSPLVLVPLTIVIVVLLAARGYRGWAIYLAVTSLGGAVVSEVVDAAVGRERPVWSDPIAAATDYAFPSGHALAGVTTWVVYGIVVLFVVPGGRGIAAGLWTAGVLMGVGRLLLGVHWPSDVIAGWMIGAGWVLAVSAAALGVVNHREVPPDERV